MKRRDLPVFARLALLPLVLGLLASVFACAVRADEARDKARKSLDMYLSTRPLPPDIVSDAKALFDTMCDKEVAPAKALELTEKLVDNKAGRVGAVLKLAKESKEKGEALAKAVEAKIAEK